MWCIKVPNYHCIAIFPFISVNICFIYLCFMIFCIYMYKCYILLTYWPLYRCMWPSLSLVTTFDAMIILSDLSIVTPDHGSFSGCSDGKESAWKARDLGLIPGSGRFPGEGTGYPFQYSCLENFMDRGTWQATVHGIAKSQTQLKWLITY